MQLYFPWCFTSGREKLADVPKEFSSLFKQQYPEKCQTWTKTDDKESWEARGKYWKDINFVNKIFDTHFLRLSEWKTRPYTLVELHNNFLLMNPSCPFIFLSLSRDQNGHPRWYSRKTAGFFPPLSPDACGWVTKVLKPAGRWCSVYFLYCGRCTLLEMPASWGW